MTKRHFFSIAATLLALLAALPLSAQIRGFRQRELKEWDFSKDESKWEHVTVPHSYNAQDGHSRTYYRGDGFYRCTFNIVKSKSPCYLYFEGVGQTAEVRVNGEQVAYHQGAYTPFVVRVSDYIKQGENTLEVVCNNEMDLEMAPVTADYNMNGGIHNPVWVSEMEEVYFSPETFGMYRLRCETPEVTDHKVVTNVKTKVVNDSGKDVTVKVRLQLLEPDGTLGYQADRSIDMVSYGEYDFDHEILLSRVHRWDGTRDPFMYTLRLELFRGNRLMDITETRIGYRSIEMDRERGFILNGRPYPLRGVCMHQDMEGKASALSREDYRRDYAMIEELGANFVRHVTYPLNDYALALADSLGIVVQTEVPWVNVCGTRARQVYFNNIGSQMEEMINNFYNHPCIAFWGMWNELGETVNNESLQGPLDEGKVVEQTRRLYELGKELDPDRYFGIADDSVLRREGYTNLKVDFVSENRYNGWHYDLGDFDAFSDDMNEVHDKVKVPVCVTEYGVGINPFCQTWDASKLEKDDARHYEGFGNLLHESYIRQIKKMPWLNYTATGVMFDFAVSGRNEGYMDSFDGEHFTETPSRRNINDMGLVTRDRQTRKDVFYLYKSLWNKKETTVCITGKRLKEAPAGKEIAIKVYSNAKSLTLYQNDHPVKKLSSSGESSGVVWTFPSVKMKGNSDTFKVVADDGTSDEFTLVHP